MNTHRAVSLLSEQSAFAGYRFPPEIILLAVRWYLRYDLSHRDVEELLAERGVEVDHVTMYRWVQRFTPMLIDAARPSRHAVTSPLPAGSSVPRWPRTANPMRSSLIWTRR